MKRKHASTNFYFCKQCKEWKEERDKGDFDSVVSGCCPDCSSPIGVNVDRVVEKLKKDIEMKELANTNGFNEGQVELIKSQIAPGASNDELKLFMHVCNRTGLDPFARQVYAVMRRSKDKWGNWIDKMQIQVSIDGARLVAERSHGYEGQTPPMWCGPDGKWVDVWLKNEPPKAAKVGVYRSNFKEPLIAVALWDNYVQLQKNKQTQKYEPNSMWQKMGPLMISKCFTPDTEVLTNKGFRRFDQIKRESILQVIDGSILRETKAKPFKQEYSGEMVNYETDMLNFSVTPNHDMVTTFGKVEAGAMYETSHSRGPWVIPTSLDKQKIVIDKKRKQWLRLIGFIIADGNQIENGYRVSVSKDYKIKELNKLDFDRSHIENASGKTVKTAKREIRTNFNKKVFFFFKGRFQGVFSDGKILSREFLNSLRGEEAGYILEGWQLFDGHTNKKTGVKRIYCSNEDLVGQIEVLACKAGLCISQRKERESDISNKVNYCLTISEQKNIKVFKKYFSINKNKEKEVWCVTVPSGEIIVRRNGFSMRCGNCAEMLALRKAFPQELSGLYSSEEMGQADNPSAENIKNHSNNDGKLPVPEPAIVEEAAFEEQKQEICELLEKKGKEVTSKTKEWLETLTEGQAAKVINDLIAEFS